MISYVNMFVPLEKKVFQKILSVKAWLWSLGVLFGSANLLNANMEVF